MIRQRSRALTVGITIVTLFMLGILLSGIRVVEAPNLMSGSGTLFNRILQRPWFLGQFFAGGIGVAAAWISSALASSDAYRRIISHSRIAEIGTLYTAVAGMLNLLAIIDSSHRAATGERRRG